MNAFDVQGQWPLNDLAIIRLAGPDAFQFLHGQLSNAVLGLDSTQARPAAYCTAKGRLLANGVIWSDAEQSVSYMVSKDLADGVLRRLRMFVLRAKVTLSLDEAVAILGAQGASQVPASLCDQPAWSQQAQDDAHWIVAPHSRPELPAAWRIGKAVPTDVSPTDAPALWQAAQINSGWPWIRAATQDLFLPSALNLDLNGSIDFKKGCYPGQEVVARSHYRGTVKRRMVLAVTPWPEQAPAPAAGGDLFISEDESARPVGRIIDCAVFHQRLYVAAEITLADANTTRYAVGSAQGPVLDMLFIPAGES